MITVNEMPSTYLISFAISEYDHFENLPNSVRDSDDLVEILTEKYKVELHEKLHNDTVNLNNIEKTFNKLKGKIKPNDSVLIIYNGHGKTKDDVPFWLLKNSLEEETHSWFRVSMLFDEIKGIDKAKNIAVIVNSCYSGNIFNQPYILHNPTSVKNEFKSRVVFTSGVTDQLVDEENFGNFRNSPFVKSIISMLKENVNKYELPLSEIINYTREEFKNHNYNSNPRDGYFSNHEGGEFYFLLRNDEFAQWNEAKKEDTIEGYEGFMQKFSSDNSGYFEKARKRKLELIKEREEWLSHIEQAYNIINNFCNKPKIDNPKYLEESKALLTLLQKNKSGITQDQSAEIKWNTIKSSRNIEDFTLFEQEFPKSRYVTNSKRIRANLQKDLADINDWEAIPDKRSSERNRRARFAEYLLKHKFGKFTSEAAKKMKDLDAWIDAIEEDNVGRKREKLKKYIDSFGSDGEYIKDANREYSKVSIKENAEKIAEAYEKAVEEGRVNFLYELREEINGLTEPEKLENESTLSSINEYLSSIEAQCNKEYKEAKKSDSVYSLNKFIEKYKGVDFADDMSGDILERLQEKEKESFEVAELSKKIEDFKDYLREFEELDGIFIDEAKERISEIEYFKTLSTKEDFNVYLQTYPKGLMRKDAQENIYSIEREERKEALYQKILNEDSIDLCKEYLEEFQEEDSKKQVVENKLEHLVIEVQINDLMDKILAAKGEEKLELCDRFLLKFEKSEEAIKVQEVRKDLLQELNDKKAFKEALEIGNIDSFNSYLKSFPEGNHTEKAREHLDYLTIKGSREVADFEDYLKKYPDSDNAEKVYDHITFFNALSKNKIDGFKSYLENSKEKFHIKEAKIEIQRLMDEKEEEEDFRIAKETDDYDLYWSYLNKPYKRKQENEKYAKERIKAIMKLKEEKALYEKAIKENKDELYIEYLKEYGKEGGYYKEITRRLSGKEFSMEEMITSKLNSQNRIILALVIIVLVLMILIIGLMFKAL